MLTYKYTTQKRENLTSELQTNTAIATRNRTGVAHCESSEQPIQLTLWQHQTAQHHKRGG